MLNKYKLLIGDKLDDGTENSVIKGQFGDISLCKPYKIVLIKKCQLCSVYENR